MKKYMLFLLALVFVSKFLFSREIKGYKKTETTNTNKNILAGCTPPTASTYLEINNVRALIHSGGDMWWDLQGTAKYIIPKNNPNQASSLFAGSIWIGGKDVNNQLKIAAMRFRQDGNDFWPGPLVTSGENQATIFADDCYKYDKHFVISRQEVSDFRMYMNSSQAEIAEMFPNGYTIPQSILNWPAHGDVEKGYAYNLAPFKDVNENNIYEPLLGDYPYFDLDRTEVCGTSREQRKSLLYGDQTLWWVFNDKGNIHSESNGEAIGIEIHAQAYSFATNDEINNMTFYNYEIINRSTYTLNDTYFGIWTDADLGAADDDYVGCDVNRGLGFLYNGDAIDGNSAEPVTGTYGENPPAIGIDYFAGPYQDADGQDNLSNWNADGVLDCANGYRENINGVKELIGSGDILNGNINGLNFGDGISDNERLGMSNFIYFYNATGPAATQDPSTASEHYNYLIGKWKSGDPMYYGGNGFNMQLPANQLTDFMFPGTTDPCGWGQKGVVMPSWDEYNGTAANNPAGDRRFVQSAGPFTLEPGMVNDITTGVVWARAYAGECGSSVPQEFCSVLKVQEADDKAQKFFESCFKVYDGPNAPELSIIELDKELILNIWNKKTSNNYLESYNIKDDNIICPLDISDCNKNYKFQGYQIFQLKDKSVTFSDLHDSQKAVLVFQSDIKDGVSQIVNYIWDSQLKENIPVEEVFGADNGISHKFTVTSDMFGTGDKSLINHKKYYFMAVAYAHNNFKTFDLSNPNALDGQKLPYKAGFKMANGSYISAFEASPHMKDTVSMLPNYGALLAINQLDGYGGGYNVLELEDETINEIMKGEPWRANTLKYKKGFGPIKVKVIDPLNVPNGEYEIKMIKDSVRNLKGYYYYNTYYNPDSINYDVDGYIHDAKWIIQPKAGSSNDEDLAPICSDTWISFNEEQIIAELGLSIEISQTPYPLAPQMWANQPLASAKTPENAGYLTSSIEYANESKKWLWFLADKENHTFEDWIKSGTEIYSNYINDDKCDDVFDDRVITSPSFPIADATVPMDPNETFEKLINGTWAPYKLTSTYFNGTAKNTGISEIKSKEKKLSNVDIVFTSDKSKWTRCVVVETTDNDINIITNYDGTECETIGTTNSYSIGGAKTFEMRKSPSVDKDGNPCAFADLYPDSASTNPDDANFISATGMGWFPGYAIDVETGERLNLMFGESSRLAGENGADMKFNPTNRKATDLYIATDGTAGEVLMGGKHFIYVLGHNSIYKGGQIQTTMFAYDYGKMVRELIVGGSIKNKELFMNAMWTAIPMHNTDYDFLACDVKVKLRVVSPYKKKMGSLAMLSDSLAPNYNLPYYTFSTKDIYINGIKDQFLENSIHLKTFPNPVNIKLSIQYNVENSSNVVLNIYDIRGSLIYQKNIGTQKNGLHTFNWNLCNNEGVKVSDGNYFCNVIIDNETFSSKVVIIK